MEWCSCQCVCCFAVFMVCFPSFSLQVVEDCQQTTQQQQQHQHNQQQQHEWRLKPETAQPVWKLLQRLPFFDR